MKQVIGIKYKGNEYFIKVRKCSYFGTFLGLMFSFKRKAEVLLFDFNKTIHLGIHSYFVFYDFLALWLDEKKNVLEITKVKPFTFYVRPKRRYRYLIEIPINRKNEKIVKRLI